MRPQSAKHADTHMKHASFVDGCACSSVSAHCAGQGCGALAGYSRRVLAQSEWADDSLRDLGAAAAITASRCRSSSRCISAAIRRVRAARCSQILIQPALGELGAVIIAPDSLGGGWSTAVNEQGVKALLAAVEKSYALDQKKVVVTGFSMGGQGTWYWADRYPERFSAAVPISGTPTPSAATWRLPVFAVHSRDDQVQPIGPTEQRIAELKKRGINAQIVVLNGIEHFETYSSSSGLRQAVPWIQEIWKTK